jgi:1,4-alpha-glucan branching enzyme
MEDSRDYDELLISKYQLHLFNDGRNYYSYKALGAHIFKKGEKSFVRFAVWAPNAESVRVIGDFNNWSIDSSYFMKRTPDSSRYWITINNLTLQQEYAYQYYVDGQIKIADPYTEKVLDPNDQYITPATYPNLKPYPADKTDNIVSILQTGQAEYQWQATNFTRPAKTDLVIYELLVRDFVSTHNYKTLKDTLGYLKRLGITAIELMPVNEFEGNESWGYNPSFYFAADKYYGTKNDLKAFIDECHKNGIAVIQDMVLNHSFGQSPMVRLYWDSQNNRPAANSPWFNPIPKHEFNVGYDFNHESPATKAFSKRVMEFWLSEYKVDGFRFDLSKGFTQKNTLGNVDAMAQYDQSRINIWKDYSSFIWSVDSNAYVILEHFADNSEEKVLSAAGMMMWGNMNKKYSEATMGWNDADNSDFSFVSYKARGWQRPNLVGYMESHDEERLMFKDIKYGNKSTIYNIQDTSQSLNRIKLAAAFFFTIPGPKMIWQFGELGYDYSIDYNGRLGNKPIRWDYYNDPKRRKLYKVFQALIKLREENKVFKSTNYSIFLSGAVKRINIADSSMNVTIIGNFDVLNKSIIPSFQNTGIWYDYFSGDSINVANTQDFMNLQPGEFHIYTSKRLATPETDILSDVQETNANEVKDFSLEQNYPNPFNPVTTIKYTVGTRPSITGGVFVQLKVYDLLGREVTTLVNKEQGPGKYEVKFNGGKLSSGLYIYRIQYGSIMLSRKMLLLK